MPIIVSTQKYDNRTVLRIESGYRTGQLMEVNGCIMFFQTPESATKWAKETGYTVFEAYDEVLEREHNNDYQKLLDRTYITKGCSYLCSKKSSSTVYVDV